MEAQIKKLEGDVEDGEHELHIEKVKEYRPLKLAALPKGFEHGYH